MKPIYLICYQFKGSLWLLFSVDLQQKTSTPYLFGSQADALLFFEPFRQQLMSLHPSSREYHNLLGMLVTKYPAKMMCFDQDLELIQNFIVDQTPLNPQHPLAMTPHTLIRMKPDFNRFKVLDVLQYMTEGTRIVDGELTKFKVFVHRNNDK